MLPTDLLNLGPFNVHAVVLLSVLETSQDIRILWRSTAKQWKLRMEAPTFFTVPMEGLSIVKGTLPGIHIFAGYLTPTN